MARIIAIGDGMDEAINAASVILALGRPVAIPTETVYGLAADATNPAAITRSGRTRPQVIDTSGDATATTMA